MEKRLILLSQMAMMKQCRTNILNLEILQNLRSILDRPQLVQQHITVAFENKTLT